MKYFLYFHFYIISIGGEAQTMNLGTVLTVGNDSLKFYVYEVGYVKWKIDKTVRETIDVHHYYKSILAIYFVSYKDIRAIVQVVSPNAQIKILNEGIPFEINLKK